MGDLTEQVRIGEELMKYVQKNCQQCTSAKLGALSLAERVVNENLDVETAAEDFATEIASDCYGGNAHEDEPGRAFECWSGIRTPVTPTHLREGL